MLFSSASVFSNKKEYIMKFMGYSYGTSQSFIDWEFISNFSGVGEYDTHSRWVVRISRWQICTIYFPYHLMVEVNKSDKVPRPKDIHKKTHESVHKYGYGQMFFGRLYKRSFWEMWRYCRANKYKFFYCTKFT